MDFDYINKLTDDEKAWLSKFVVEYYSADFRGDDNLIKGKKARREVYRANNARNSDLVSLLSAYGMVGLIKDSDSVANLENHLLTMLDLSKKLRK